MRIPTIAIAVLALAALVVSCSGEEPSPAPATSAFRPTGATGTTRIAGGTTVTGTAGLPDPATGPTGGVPATSDAFITGEVTLQLSGDLEVERTIGELVSGTYSTPPGGMVLVLSNDGGCTIEVDSANGIELVGRSSCRDLRDPTGVTVDVAGSFRATG